MDRCGRSASGAGTSLEIGFVFRLTAITSVNFAVASVPMTRKNSRYESHPLSRRPVFTEDLNPPRLDRFRLGPIQISDNRLRALVSSLAILFSGSK